MGEVCIIVFRGVIKQILDEVERFFYDVLCVLIQIVKEIKIVFGGGIVNLLYVYLICKIFGKNRFFKKDIQI